MEKFSKQLVPIIFCALPLAGCFADPQIKADNQLDFQTSLAVMMKHLSISDQHRLDLSLRDIVLIQSGFYRPLLDAKNYAPPATDGEGELTQGLANSFVGGTSDIVESIMSAKWEENRAQLVVENARAIVDGRTASELFSIAADERRIALKSAIAIYQTQLTKAEIAIKATKADAEAARREEAVETSLLSKVVISHARFTYRRNGFLSEPVISFSIANDGSIPIERILVNGTLQTPDRSAPWVSAPFNYEIIGGLEPHETQSLDLQPNMFSSWGSVPRTVVTGAVLSLTLIAFEDASGRRHGVNSVAISDAEARRNSLESEIQQLKRKISNLQSEI